MEPQCHPRLNVQSLIPTRWTWLPEHAPHVELTWLEERHGWRAQCTEILQVMALHIPEEDRSEINKKQSYFSNILSSDLLVNFCTFDWITKEV